MNYRKITEQVKKVKAKEVITFIALLEKSNYKDYTSSVTIDTLSNITGQSEKTIRRHIKALTEAGLITVQRVTFNGLDGIINKNKYTISTENYDLVDTQAVLDLDLDLSVKGFLVQLKALCYDGSNKCQFTIDRIAEELNMKRRNVYNYIKILTDRKMITKKKDTITIKNTSIFLTVDLGEFRRIKDTYNEILTDEDILNGKIN